MLLEPLGKKLKEYQSMFALYEVVMNMPTHEARRRLKKNERMKLDLRRECGSGFRAKIGFEIVHRGIKRY